MSPLELLRAHGQRKVRAVAREESKLADALFEFCKAPRAVWNKVQWDAVLKELDGSSETLANWLFIRE